MDSGRRALWPQGRAILSSGIAHRRRGNGRNGRDYRAVPALQPSPRNQTVGEVEFRSELPHAPESPTDPN
jgi:hypothetical protein